MTDWELLKALSEAERIYNELLEEFKSRGLDKKPLVEYSNLPQPNK